jgi:Lrp/AsnC family transcriptional regulator, leucine-responsive regulatory protein
MPGGRSGRWPGAVGASPPAIAGRLARLERTGVIRGYRAAINWAALGCPLVVYLAVSSVPGRGLGPVIRAISELSEVQEMSVVTGGPDLLVRLRVSGYAHLRSLLLDTIFKVPGVQRTEVFLSLGEVGRPTSPPGCWTGSSGCAGLADSAAGITAAGT